MTFIEYARWFFLFWLVSTSLVVAIVIRFDLSWVQAAVLGLTFGFLAQIPTNILLVSRGGIRG